MVGRGTGLLVAVAMAPLFAPVAAVASPANPVVIATRPASPASEASMDARTLRRDVARLLQQYIDSYSDRFSPAERRQLLGYRAAADRKLAAVVLSTRRLEQLTIDRAPVTGRRSAAAAAQQSWRSAKATADASFESARQIMEPRLSILERLSAAHDYTAMMGRFDDLGARIDAAAAGIR